MSSVKKVKLKYKLLIKRDMNQIFSLIFFRRYSYFTQMKLVCRII